MGLLVPGALAQVEVGDEEAGGEFTIEVDESKSKNEGKSLGLALLASAAVPGGGEYYLQDKGKARAFLLVEAGFWAALYAALVTRDSYLQSARNFASEYAGIDADGKGDDFLELMARYRAYREKQHRQDGYELAQILDEQELGGDYSYPLEGNDWDFGSSINPDNTANWRRYEGSLRYYRGAKVAFSFAVGALVVNRVASLVNTLHLYKKTSAPSSAARLEFRPQVGPGIGGGRIAIRF